MNEQHYLREIVLLFGSAVVVAGLMRFLRAPSIIGFLCAGIVIGPAGFQLVERSDVQFFADLGLALLLFTIGLELSSEPLLRNGGPLLRAAALQIGLTALVAAAVVLGPFSLSRSAALLIGLCVALSSTAIVLKQLSERGEIDTPAGSLITGVLLIQDICVILVMLVLPWLAQAGETPWLALLGKIGLAFGSLVAVTAVARLILPVVVNTIFRYGGSDLMTLFAIGMACTGAWLAGLAQWSWALGACVAGLLLAQTNLRHQLQAETTPFRDAFNALFFMSIGMLVNVSFVQRYAGLLILLILGSLVLKTIITAAAIGLAGWPLRLAITAGLGLCTISEFGYVLASEATRLAILKNEMLELVVAWAVGTMLIGAALVPVAAPVAAWLAARIGNPNSAVDESRGKIHGHVIIVGYGVNGQNLATVLRATRIPFLVVEQNRAATQRAVRHQHPLLIGDATRRAILETGGIAAARALVVAISDAIATRRIVSQARALRPDLYILARTRYEAELDQLYRLGARRVIPEEFETSIEIFAHVLKEFSVPDNVIEQQVTLVRQSRYGMLRGLFAGRPLPAEWLQTLEAALTQTFLITSDSPGAGRTIREVDLRARTGVTIIAITRNGRATTAPPPEFQLQPGDVLVLIGTHRQLDLARKELTSAATAQ